MPKIFSPFIAVIVFVSLVLITAACSLPIILIGLIKLLLPHPRIWRKLTTVADYAMWFWCEGLFWITKINSDLVWDVEGIDALNRQGWSLLISNHKSWCDILVLCVLFRNRLPMNKYFLKQELIWVPFVGLACWALDMPFMKRYSREFLNRHPHLKGKDIETTRRSCEKFRLRPTTIVNFVEGTRCTQAKQHKTGSVYKNLLTPKAAGVAFTLNTLGKQFDVILNVTLFYPNRSKYPLLDLILGRLQRIIVRVETLPITDDIRGDYFNDEVFRNRFQLWLNQLWHQKDNQIEAVKKIQLKQQ